jgi:hypothetical protein
MSDFYFDPTQQKDSFELIPPGDYMAEIVEAVNAPPKSSGDGYMLTLKWRIVEGEYENRPIWQRLNYIHSNFQTQDIARKQLTNICNGLGIHEQITDLDTFLHKPVRVKVGIEVDKTGRYDDSNCIKRVKPMTDGDAEAQEAKRHTSGPTTTAAKPTSKPQDGNGPGTAPWNRPQG